MSHTWVVCNVRGGGHGPSVLLAGWAADAEEGVGALEQLLGLGRVVLRLRSPHGGAFLADRVALLDDVVAGVEPREGEVAAAAATQLAPVGLPVALAFPHRCVFFGHGRKDAHDQDGMENQQDHHERAALHRCRQL